ncbi:hypothetical protein [Methanobacterium sp.]|uniref:hypothetical protein n=1 Tax=Methanobacterium sp. TaxID=2164 RepID=UPI003C74BBF9
MEIERESLTITYNRYIHFKNQEDTNEFAKILLANGHYFAIQKNSIWVRVNEYKDESLEEESKIKMLLADYTNKYSNMDI